MNNKSLDQFCDGLRESFYKPGKPEDLDLVEQAEPEALIALKYKHFGKIPLDYETAGYRVVIEQGFSGEENIYLINCDLKDFKFTLNEGGSVDIEFRIIATPTSEEMGKLDSLQQDEVDLTLEPPSPEQRAQMELDAMRDDEKEEFEDDAA